MARRNKKYEQILDEAKKRLMWAQQRVADVEGQLAIANAHLNAHQRNYHDLEKALTPLPRTASTKKAASAPAQKEPASGMARGIKQSIERGQEAASNALCVAMVPTLDVPCGEREDSLIHDEKSGYLSYHPFEPSKPVVRAGRKSKQKPGVTYHPLRVQRYRRPMLAM